MSDEQLEEKSQEQETLDPHCISCGMPMRKPEDFGTNSDGSKNSDYCCHCLVNGQKR
jgi:hypothetical protein